MPGATEAFIRTEHGWLRFGAPRSVVQAAGPRDVIPRLREVEEQVGASRSYAVGFVSYEAADAFGLAVHAPGHGLPRLWFALFSEDDATRCGPPTREGSYSLTSMRGTVDARQFRGIIEDIKARLAAGDTYQANYTFALEAAFDGDPQALFADLVAAQQGAYAVYLRCARFTVCSASPELFFDRIGSRLTTRPMKGTRRRGRTGEEDRAQMEALRGSTKDQAENVMIVDMIRNDLGRIATTGTVRVADLFTVERYPNVWQMTSTVTAESTAPLAEIFSAMHPSASVTGAPKVRTMELLREWERGPRGVYTGAVGYIAPDGHARFNVAIRTAVVDHERGRVHFGVGSGIVWDSDPDEEYQECLAKGEVFGWRPPVFELLETLRWSPGEGFVLLERHLDRLRRSADYFGYVFDEAAVRGALADGVTRGEAALRVRLLAAKNGTARVEKAALASPPAMMRVAVAANPIDDDEVFLYHKTTNRTVYDRARREGCDDTILWNQRGEVTESTTANVVVELDGHRLTPPVSCGLLAGTFRAELLARGDINEAVVTLAALRTASRIWLINSVHGWREAVLVQAE